MSKLGRYQSHAARRQELWGLKNTAIYCWYYCRGVNLDGTHRLLHMSVSDEVRSTRICTLPSKQLAAQGIDQLCSYVGSHDICRGPMHAAGVQPGSECKPSPQLLGCV